VFVIDPKGIIQFANSKLLGATFVGADKLVGVLEQI
jgi:hypothetical protein